MPPVDEQLAGLAFACRARRHVPTEGDPLVLLHGSATNENSLLPLAAAIAPRADHFAVRGRVVQDGDIRWFERLTPVSFVQASIVEEADAFAGFVRDLGRLFAIDPARMVFIGYSNGANLVTAVMLRHPGLIRRAVLLRAMPVLDAPPAADLSGTCVLLVAGERDVTYGPYAPALAGLLHDRGADVTFATVPGGHEFGDDDAALVRAWLRDDRPLSS